MTNPTGRGLEMMLAAEEAAQKTALQSGRNAPLGVGVTVLTSMDSNNLSEVGMEANVARQVERLAALAVKAGLRGLVCASLKLAALRQIVPGYVQLGTPR